MPSLAERQRNNVRAGIFVSVTLILSLVVIVVLSGLWGTLFRRAHAYVVTYDVSTGVRNLEAGSEVRVGGLVMGTVTAVRPRLVEGQPFDTIHVDIEVSRDVELFADAVMLVNAPLLGTDAWLDIPSVGTAAAGAPPNREIEGAETAGMLAALLGPEHAGRAGDIIDNAADFSAYLSEVPGKVNPILDDVKTVTADARAVAADLREERWPNWSRSIDDVMTWANGFTGRLDEALADGHGLLNDGREVIAENRGDVRDTIANARGISERVRDETVEKVHALLERGGTALDEATATIETLRADYEGWTVDVGETLGNAALASQQLKLATIEVRRSPWKLLYRPSETELEHELLYEAARSFAVAAADLKAASTSVRRIVTDHGDILGADEALLERVRRNLWQPLENYEVAQQRLLDVLFADGARPGRPPGGARPARPGGAGGAGTGAGESTAVAPDDTRP